MAVRPIAIGGIAAVGLAALTGAFGTHTLAPITLLAFWAALIGWNCCKWLGWFALTVRKADDWRGASLAGAIVVNLPLPLEIAMARRLAGDAGAMPAASAWSDAAAISAILYVLAVAIVRRPRTLAVTRSIATSSDTILARAGVRAAEVIAVRAEDHYCRLHLIDGRSLLLLARFGELPDETALPVSARYLARVRTRGWLRSPRRRG